MIIEEVGLSNLITVPWANQQEDSTLCNWTSQILLHSAWTLPASIEIIVLLHFLKLYLEKS